MKRNDQNYSQVTGNQPSMPPQGDGQAYTGQAPFTQGGYPQQGYGQVQNGYAGAGGYPQQGYPQQSVPGYTYPGNQAPGGSYIPQTPYSQGGYQAPGGYSQNYNAYTQMGRNPQGPAGYQDMGGQVPLNGGGYVPNPVPVRKKPFEMTDAYLLILSAVLLILFALGMFVPGLGILKWIFLILAAGTTALFWLKPLTANNKRLCYTIVFGLLAVVTVISIATAGGSGRQTDRQQTNAGPASTASVVTDPFGAGAALQNVTSTPTVTNTPEPSEDNVTVERALTFFYYWSGNRQDDMLTLCSPSWQNSEENPKAALFALMANRTPKEIERENISGTPNDTTRTVTLKVLMDRNNGKDPVRYRMNVIMVKENDGLWYVDPKSLKSNETLETPDPSITNTPAPTETPVTNSSTTLYYNPSGGEFYHRDQNCKRINERYLPLKGHFTYAELDKDEYKKLKPCAICGAPSRGMQ